MTISFRKGNTSQQFINSFLTTTGSHNVPSGRCQRDYPGSEKLDDLVDGGRLSSTCRLRHDYPWRLRPILDGLPQCLAPPLSVRVDGMWVLYNGADEQLLLGVDDGRREAIGCGGKGAIYPLCRCRRTYSIATTAAQAQLDANNIPAFSRTRSYQIILSMCVSVNRNVVGTINPALLDIEILSGSTPLP